MESSSFHRTFNAGSERALHVRESLETDRRPPGVSRMYSSKNFVTSGSLKTANIFAILWRENTKNSCKEVRFEKQIDQVSPVRVEKDEGREQVRRLQ